MVAAGTGIFPVKGEIFMILCSSTNSHGPCTRLRIHTAIVPLVLSFILVMAAPSRAHSPDPAPSTQRSPEAERLTHTLLTLSAQLHVAATAERARLLSNLLSVAAARQQLLAGLVRRDPAEVLRAALPAHLRAGLPPALEPYMEEDVVIPGVLEVLHEDRDRGSRYLYFLETAGERFSLHFAAEPPELWSGSHVRVSGLRIKKALALASGKTGVRALTSTAPNTFGAQSTLVILVNFQDNATQPYTVDYARNVVFTTASNFNLENSYQQTWLIGDVAGWYTIPLNSTVCDYSAIASYAKSAASAAGFNLSAYKRYVYAFPQNACTWWGLGSVGGNPSQAWVNGSFQLGVVGHEMGHNFGLYHSHSLDCGTTTLGTDCTASEYGDTLDIMGGSLTAHYNAFQKERLGWLAYGVSPPITSVQADGTYTLDPYEADGSGANALKILKSTDPTTGKRSWYYVESRQAIGFDGFLSSNSNVVKGVVIHTGSESSGNSSYLLDLTPATSSWSDPALDVGQTFYDPDSGVTIVPVSVSSTGAAVSVSFGPPACARANPSMTLSPSQSRWLSAGTIVAYTVTVTNKDNAGCTTSSFSLQASVPDGWSASFGDPALAISPGASASTTLQITSPISAADGFYTVGIVATNSADPAYAASTSATYVIVSRLDVAVSTDHPSYAPIQSVSITANVTAEGSAAAGASVTFTITKPTGGVTTGTATTRANGTALYKFRLKRTDRPGTYRVGVNASLGGVSGTASTSFTVQ